MKVKIINWSEDKYYWYKSRIGEVFEVKDDSNNSNYYYTSTGARIVKADTIPVNEIKYISKDMILHTNCPAGFSQMVGSIVCGKCEYNCGTDRVNQTVQCSWQKESKEMDLKSIAVRFENFEQYEAIIEKFKDSGFELSSAENVYSSGEVGYTSSCDYVCVLTESALQGKKIISYEQFIGGKEMKRLEVTLKIQPDGKTVVAECTHIAEELRGMGTLAGKDEYKIHSFDNLNFTSHNNNLCVRGSNRHLDYIVDYKLFDTSQEAQEFVKIMNELIDEVNNPKTDWSKVEEGAEVKVNNKNGMISGYIAKFHSYVPKLNKVIVIFGESVNAVDEDKVELC